MLPFFYYNSRFLGFIHMKAIHNNKLADGSNRFQTAGVVTLSISHFIHDVYSSFLAPLLPLLIEKLSMSLTQAGFLSTVMQIPALLNPVIGQLADRFPARWFIILAPAMTAIPMSLIGIAPNYGVLLILMFFVGISVSMFHVPSPVMISRLSGNRKGLGMSFYMTGGEFARTIGPLIAVGAVSLWGLEGFYPIMVVGIGASFFLFLKFQDAGQPNLSKKPIPVLQTWRKMRYILGPIAGILIARGFMHASVTAFLPTFIKSSTGNLWLGGIGLTLFEAAGVAGVLTAGATSDVFGRRRILFISLAGAPISLLLFTFTHGWFSFAMLILSGFTLLSTTPVMLALVQEHADSSPSAANGLFMMISFLARSAIVVIIGMMGDKLGLQTTYLISAVLGFLGVPFIFLLPTKTHPDNTIT